MEMKNIRLNSIKDKILLKTILILVFFTSAGVKNINLTLTSKDSLNNSILFASENVHIDFRISIHKNIQDDKK